MSEQQNGSLAVNFSTLQQREQNFHTKRAPNKVLTSNSINSLLNRAAEYGYNQQSMQQQLVEDANNTKVIIDSSVQRLIKDFLFHKIKQGNEQEKKVYKKLFGEKIQEITTAADINEEHVKKFIDRLLTKRPLVFYLPGDKTLLAKGAPTPLFKGRRYDRDIPTDDYISYDEMLISANIGVSSPTFFINEGGRYNMGDPADTKTFVNQGVYIGLVGPRFEKFGKPGRMEAKHMFITKDQNTQENGYGSNNSNLAAQELESWKKFYGIENNFPTWDEVQAQGKQDSDNYLYVRASINQGVNNIPEGYLNIAVYKARLKKVIEPFLMEANQRAQEAGTQAYVHAVGLGLGVWAVDAAKQAKLMLEVYKEVLEQHEFANIADIDFSYITKDSSVGIEDLAKKKNITVHFTTNDPAGNPEKLQGNPKKLLVAAYAWDGGSYPGNEYWYGPSAYAASGDPAAAACSMITTLQNPEINPEFTKRIVYTGSLKQKDSSEKAAAESATRQAAAAALSSANLSSPSFRSQIDKKRLKFYSESCKTHFINTIENSIYIPADSPSQKNNYTVGELRSTIASDGTEATDCGELLAVIQYGHIECPKTEKRKKLLDSQYSAFIAFLKMQSALAGDNPVTIKINDFSPEELQQFLEKLNDIDNIPNIILKLPNAPETCGYGDKQHYTKEQYDTANLAVKGYNQKNQKSIVPKEAPDSAASSDASPTPRKLKK